MIQDIIDTLIEVGNGTTEEQLHNCADKLIKLNCQNCKWWDNSDGTVSWNKQHQDHLKYPYEEYGECGNGEMENRIFQDVQTFGNNTHKSFGCIYFEAAV